MPYKTWSVGEELLAAELNSYIQEQVVAVFNDAGARSADMDSPTEGQVSYLKSTNALYIFDGATWVAMATQPAVDAGHAAQQAEINTLFADAAALQNYVSHLGKGYVSATAFTAPQAYGEGASTIIGSGFLLPEAGRRYAIHATTSIQQDNWGEPANKVTFGIVPNASVGTYTDYQTAWGGAGNELPNTGDCHAFHCYTTAIATVTSQYGECVINSNNVVSSLLDGRVSVIDIGT